MSHDDYTKYWRLPSHVQASMLTYVEKGTPPGSFLRCVLENKLYESFVKADEINRRRMIDFAAFLENGLPAAAWGSPEQVDAWIELGGLEGLRNREGNSQDVGIVRSNHQSDEEG
jgi:hypothetical protein